MTCTWLGQLEVGSSGACRAERTDNGHLTGDPIKTSLRPVERLVMDKENPDSIGAYEAKTHFSELLERVERGEEVTITRHGAPVAKLVPVRKRLTTEERLAISAQMKRFARGNKLRGLRVKDMISEGRR